ncbi:MAG: hypothetical protein GX654_17755 [Desulfatiglans sp.]|nr:hypothetical protein [Desulfatiglans sp.]
MRELKATIQQLINLKKEGDSWDFKLVHHKEVGDLLFDILCLANSLSISTCYLIFGVDPNSFEIVGLQEPRPRAQADIIDFLVGANFAGARIPSIELVEITMNGKSIDVLVIRQTGKQPFYLEKDYVFGKKRISRGVVYSREGDRNTAMDSIAPPDRIEELWMRRFGLHDSPIQKFNRILANYSEWRWDGINSAYFIPDPDYTIKIQDNETLGAGKYWWGNLPIEKPIVDELSLLFRNVELEKIITVSYYNECLTIPFPDIKSVLLPEDPDYYDICYYIEGTRKHAYLQHLYASRAKSVPSPLVSREKPPIIILPFLILEQEDNLNSVLKWVNENWGKQPWINRVGLTPDQKNQEFSWWIYEAFNK